MKCFVLICAIRFEVFPPLVPKKIRTPPTEEISAVRRGGGRDCLKNVLNLYRMSGEGKGGIANFLRGGGGYGSFLEQPISVYCKPGPD